MQPSSLLTLRNRKSKEIVPDLSLSWICQRDVKGNYTWYLLWHLPWHLWYHHRERTGMTIKPCSFLSWAEHGSRVASCAFIRMTSEHWVLVKKQLARDCFALTEAKAGCDLNMIKCSLRVAWLANSLWLSILSYSGYMGMPVKLTDPHQAVMYRGIPVLLLEVGWLANSFRSSQSSATSQPSLCEHWQMVLLVKIPSPHLQSEKVTDSAAWLRTRWSENDKLREYNVTGR